MFHAISRRMFAGHSPAPERRGRLLPTPPAERARRARCAEVDQFIKSGRREAYPQRLIDVIDLDVPRVPVCIVGDPSRQVFNLDSLRQWDKQNGTHPLTRHCLAGAQLEPLEGERRDDMIDFFRALAARWSELGHPARAAEAFCRSQALLLRRPTEADLQPLTGGFDVDAEATVTADLWREIGSIREAWLDDRQVIVDLMRILSMDPQQRMHAIVSRLQLAVATVDHLLVQLGREEDPVNDAMMDLLEELEGARHHAAELSHEAYVRLDDLIVAAA